MPVHVTQRGNFRGRVFTEDSDYSFFLDMLGRYAGECGNRIIGYCLLSNHYHLVLIPSRDRGVSDMMHSLNSKFARTINERYERRGHVLQGRFGSASMSDKHYRTALAYVDLNPVRAGIVTDATEYRWSSAAAHAGVVEYPRFLEAAEFLRMYTPVEWREILRAEEDADQLAVLRRATMLGTVAGSPDYVKQLEKQYGRTLEVRGPGRPKRAAAAGGLNCV